MSNSVPSAASAVELVHDSEGLRIVRNPINRFTVVTLHHTADPRKRGDQWRREAAAGMTPEQFAREYDIDYRATSGAKVFPEFTARRSEIVVSPFPVPDGCQLWGGFDYGARNPSSFHIYTIIDECIYAVWELYKPCTNIHEFAQEMLTSPYWNRIRYIAADSKCWAMDQQQDLGNPVSVYDLFYREGIRNMIRGRKDGSAESAWIALMREYWGKEELGFKIFNTCPAMCREFEQAIYIPQSERQLLSSVYHEVIQDKDNHSLDDCKYFMLTRPKVQLQTGWKDPIMVSRFTQVGYPSHTSTGGPRRNEYK